MIEFHGWLTLRMGDEENDTERLNEIVSEFEKELLMKKFSFEANIKCFNGNFQFWVSGNANHKNPEFHDLMKIIRSIATKANYSYGLIYIWDDEDGEYNNDFQVYIVKRGRCELKKDNLLSPCVPTIENEY